MTILHYTLGLPPQRSGGLTQYSCDVMVEQAKNHRVVLLYAQGYRWWSRRIGWKRARGYKGIEVVRLKNSFPVPLFHGIKSPGKFMTVREMSEVNMEKMYSEILPDVFHVHTLMGLPIELLRFFKSKGVKLVFTSHDYFGLCLRVNFIDYQGKVCSSPTPERCALCNKGARTSFFIRVRNSSIALKMKSWGFVAKLFR